ncbi:MAG TPA: hypothetical protein VLB79_00065 [Solirubrobacterales bacterium]|nr:hypothetical protein [Solirubrobacterales bacterium]
MLTLGPVLPLALGIVAEPDLLAELRVRVVAGVARGDRVADRGDQILAAAIPAAASGRRRDDDRRGECRRSSQEYMPVN